MKQTKDEIISKVIELSEPLIVEKQFELVDVEYVKAGREMILRFFIDKEGGITLDDCADFSREFSLILDVEDFIEAHYTLEVSSPGIDRPLKKEADYLRFLGRLVKVKTFEPLPDEAGNKRKTFLGILESFENRVVGINLNEGQKAFIPLASVAKANLEFEF